MDAHYHDPTDKKYGANLRHGAGVELAAYMTLVTAASREDGVVPLKHRELISIGVARTTQCAYCLESHINAAKDSGATSEEVAETVFRGGSVERGRGRRTWTVGHEALRALERRNRAGGIMNRVVLAENAAAILDSGRLVRV